MNSIQQLSFFLIDLMKSTVLKEPLIAEKVNELLLQTGKEIDICKVNNQPIAELEYIYETALWLKSEVINNEI